MKGKHSMFREGLIAFLAAQEAMPLSDLMAATHVHGIDPGAGGQPDACNPQRPLGH